MLVTDNLIMSRKNISQEKIVQSFLSSAFEKSSGATSLADVAESLEIKKASLYNHFENKEAIYAATLAYAEKEFSSINFLADKALDSIKNNKITINTLFKKLITRYFNLFETEPTFHLYVFIYSEQFFNDKALEIVHNHQAKIADEVRKIINTFIEQNKLAARTEKEITDLSNSLASLILQQMNLYLSQRTQTVRQNPESGTGTLFELPADDAALNRVCKLVDSYLKLL